MALLQWRKDSQGKRKILHHAWAHSEQQFGLNIKGTNDNKREREINNSQQLITPRVLLDGYVIMLANMNHWSCRKITSLFNVSIVWHYELEEMTLKCVDDLLNHEGDLNHAPSDESSSSRMATQCSAGRDYESSCQMEGGCSPNINLQIFFCDH